MVVPSRREHQRARLLAGLRAMGIRLAECLPARPGLPRPPPGSATLWTSTLAPAALQASLAFGGSTSDKKRRRAPGPPPRRTVFSPGGTRRPPSKGAWVVAGY